MRTENSTIDSRFYIGEYVKVRPENPQNGEEGVIGKIIEVWQNKRQGNRIFYKLDSSDRWFPEDNMYLIDGTSIT